MSGGTCRSTASATARDVVKSHAGRLVPVLGLADEIARDHARIGGVVGDHRDLRGPGEHVDADLAEQHALRLGDELVARADDDVGGLAGEEAVRHGGDGLHAAQRHDHVGARDVHRVEHLRMDAVVAAVAAIRRGARDHRRHAGRLGGGDAHVRRRDVRVAAGRHVAAGDVDRDEALARR